MKLLLRLFALWSLVAIGHTVYAQDLSNKGKDFWIGYGNHVRMFNSSQGAEKMELYITSDVSTTGQVTISSIGFSQSFTVTANQITTISIPRTAALTNDGLYDHGIHVTANSPVVVYSFIFVSAISGATVCLPTNTLGRDYYSVNYTQISNDPESHSYFFVIAADTGTTSVEITPSALTSGGKPAGVPFLVSLKQGQVYQVLGSTSGNSGVDLTGSRIRSINTGSGCKRIAVYSGSGKISVGCNGSTADNVYQQMYPTSTWGKKYITVPSLINSYNFYRIVKSDPSATVKLNGVQIAPGSFTNNFFYEFASSSTNVIESDQPIMVAQYFTSQNCSGNNRPGDPEMIFLNPVEQTISDVTLNSMQPANINVNEHYLNVVLKNDAAAISSFKIDGAPYSSFKPISGDASYAYAQVRTTAGTHHISCDTGFNIIAYGFGNVESYGYSGGTNLKDLYQFASIKNKYSTVDFPATCVDAPFRFSMTFPYQPTRIRWNFNGLFPDETIDTPVYDSTWQINGKQIYLYRLTKVYTGPPIGNYPVKIIANNPTTDGCTGEQEIDFDLKVYNKPLASFNFNTTACLNDTVKFTETTTNDRTVIKWLWDFGTSDTAMSRNPNYRYKDTGSYTTSFYYINDIGCISDTATKTVRVNPLPRTGFYTRAPYCADNDIVFTDTSSAGLGSIAEWKWNMGDGQITTKTSGAPFTYKYAAAKNYTVTLETKTDKGCTNTAFTHVVTVHDKPLAGFILPENCLKDPFSQFTDTSKINDGSEAQFTYAWNFGDPNASAGNLNTSITKNPKHKYTATGSYDVKLLITSKDGCADSIQKQLFINGSAPATAFGFINGNELCSNDSLLLINNSSVDVGSIVKLEVFWDDVNNPSNKALDDNPVRGKNYSTKYPEFYTPATKDYTVKVIAYSGETCSNTLTQVIHTKQTPQLAFDTLLPVCSNAASFLIKQASVVNGLDGTGLFTGKAVSSNGLFRPDMAVNGKDSIVYTYNAANGCKNSMGRTIRVDKAPTVDAGVDLSVIKGRSIIIKAQSTGNNLRYEWTPTIGLDKPNVLQPSATPATDIVYMVKAISPEGCKDSSDVAITVYEKLFVPNAFTPNNDGRNDVWRLYAIDPSMGAEVSIFNREGNLVYHTKGGTISWDGRYRGQLQPSGVYIYVIDLKLGEPLIKGTMVLIR
jgi:gliding motility-associated-like protein